MRTAYYTFKCRAVVGDTGSRVNRRCEFTKNVTIGNNCHFNGCRISGKGRVTIGNNFHSGRDIVIITSNHNYEGTLLPYDKTSIVKNVAIGNEVWLGDNVVILPGVTIGDGCIVQAGSVVVKDLDSLGIYGGAPTQLIKSRNLDHFKRLKSNEAYL